VSSLKLTAAPVDSIVMDQIALSFIPLITFCAGVLAVSMARKLRARLALVRGMAGAAAEIAALRERVAVRDAQSAVGASSHSLLQMSQDLILLQEALAQAAIRRTKIKSA